MRKSFYIYLDDAINSASMTALLEHIRTKIRCNSDLFLLINSYGGSVSSALGMAQFLESLPCHITTVNMSKVESAAVILFAAGATRIALPESRFFAHSISINLNGNYSVQSLKKELANISLELSHVTSFLAEHSCKSSAYWKKIMSDSGNIITPEQALKIGLATSVSKLSVRKSELLVIGNKSKITEKNDETQNC